MSASLPRSVLPGQVGAGACPHQVQSTRACSCLKSQTDAYRAAENHLCTYMQLLVFTWISKISLSLCLNYISVTGGGSNSFAERGIVSTNSWNSARCSNTAKRERYKSRPYSGCFKQKSSQSASWRAFVATLCKGQFAEVSCFEFM